MNRRQVFLWLLVIGVMVLVWCEGQDVRGAPAWESRNLPTFEFGEISPGETMSASTLWRNPGPKSILFERSSVACGCLTLSVAEGPVAPGDELRVEATLGTSGNLLGPQEVSFQLLLRGGRTLSGVVSFQVMGLPFLDDSVLVVQLEPGQEVWSASTRLVLPSRNGEETVELHPFDARTQVVLVDKAQTRRGTEQVVRLSGKLRTSWSKERGLAVEATRVGVGIEVSGDKGLRKLELKVVLVDSKKLDVSTRKLVLNTQASGSLQLLGFPVGQGQELHLETDPPGCAEIELTERTGEVWVRPLGGASSSFDIVFRVGGEELRVPVCLVDEIN